MTYIGSFRGFYCPASDFVEVIQCFATRPQHYNTQREDQKRGHLDFLGSRNKLRGGFSVVEFSAELMDAVAPTLVFAEFCLCDGAELFFFQGVQL
jgi:hypothetical protein